MAAGSSPSGNVLTRKAGPLPVWGWVVVVVGGYLIYRRLSGKSSSSAGTAGSATGASGSGYYPFPGSGGASGGGGGGNPDLGTQPTGAGSVSSAAVSPGNAGTGSAAVSPGNTGAAGLQSAAPFDFSGNSPIGGVPVSGGVAAGPISPVFTGTSVGQSQVPGIASGTPVYAYTASAVPQGAALPGETPAETQQFLGGLPPNAVIYGPGKQAA